VSRIIILMYHIIDDAKTDIESALCCSPRLFEEQVKYLANSEYTLVNLDDIADILSGNKSFETDVVALTFDDGFEDFYLNALPILKRYKVPSTLFVISNMLGKTNNWMSERDFPVRKLISKQQLLSIEEKGVIIGSHSRSHLNLEKHTENASLLNLEINTSKHELENIIGHTIEHFAYPFGKYDNSVIDVVKESAYKTACSTKSGFNRKNEKPLLLRRIEIYNSDSLWKFKFKLKLGSNAITLKFLFNYYFSRLKNKVAPLLQA